MAQSGSEIHPARHRRGVNWAVIISVLSVGFTGATLYLSYFYVTQHLNVNVTHLHYASDANHLSMCIAFANTGNKDAAVVRVFPALWESNQWTIVDRIDEGWLQLTDPDTPILIKAGAVTIVSLDAALEKSRIMAAAASVGAPGVATIGLITQTMNSDGNLYTNRYPVADLKVVDGNALEAVALIDHSRDAFKDLDARRTNVAVARLRPGGEPWVMAW